MKSLGIVVFLAAALWAQQEIPDAPSSNLPKGSASFPNSGDRPLQPTTQTPQPSGGSTSAPATGGDSSSAGPTTPPPKLEVAPVQPGQDTTVGGTDELLTLRTTTNFVVVPVTVKDGSGRLVDGLAPKDFSIYEDGSLQKLRFFTSDPLALSVAFVIDETMPSTTMKKVNQSLGAVPGAFSPFDEVAVYTFGDNVGQQSDFASAGDKFTAVLSQVSQRPGRPAGPPILDGPLAMGPTINGIPVDPNTPHTTNPPREFHVLNDAILSAAQALSKRDASRRRVVFVVTTGIEDGSKAKYRDVLKVLLSNQVEVYGVTVDENSVPVLKTIDRLHLPGQEYANILPKYVSATGGAVYPEISEEAIQNAYSRVTEEARNQYTLGYYARATVSGTHRSIEVRVHRPNLKVYAREGYYPLPSKPAQ